MTTRFLVAGLHFFGIAAALAIAIALLAPIDAVRFLGVMALAFAGAGFLLQLYVLQRFDPETYSALSVRFHAALQKLRGVGSRATFSGNTH